MTLFEKRYKEKVIPALCKQFGWTNIYRAPVIQKVTVNVGFGKSVKEQQILDTIEQTLLRITGQKPIKTKAKKSIAGFKLRAGQVIGMKVTLRKKRMYDFLEKLVMFTIPRMRDFRGIPVSVIDDQGNCSLGFREHLAFPEIRSDEIERMHGVEISISTNARTREKGFALFTLLGFPFKK
jgi:large subunit ribosomal protein L5